VPGTGSGGGAGVCAVTVVVVEISLLRVLLNELRRFLGAPLSGLALSASVVGHTSGKGVVERLLAVISMAGTRIFLRAS
jgi:hypothetical protein